ncbi:uncharacterized protein LOC116295672 [Actinia tenebrosa]|uniref:Uncharacterized protein LOC116295672 n=1 Tax=Actinia tenebrosa TaxID=6105 RepID=A0A6P8HSS2_ACTTE|nr:uncharacterized protein LOC116295672 [Actinia tenebrosa]
MSRKQEFDGLLYKHKALEIIISASLTVNLCVVCYTLLPWVYSLVRRKLYKKTNGETTKEDNDIQVSRISSSVPFYVAFPVCGLVLIFTSNILRSPFFTFDSSLCIVFSSALGQYIYKSAEAVYWKRETNYRPLLVHNAVVIAIYAVILCYEQGAIIGVVGLLMKGSFAFAEFDIENFSKSMRKRSPSLPPKVTFVGMFVVSVILKGLLPCLLVVFSIVTSSGDLLKMQYIPLAFFFLSLVFFSAVAGWFFKDAFCGLRYMFGRSKHTYLWNTIQQPVTTLINHNGLEKLMEKEKGAGILQIKCNELWDQDSASLCSAHVLGSKLKNVDVIEVECATPSVLKSTNIVH